MRKPPEPEIIRPLDSEDWKNFLLSSESALVFHHPRWLRLLQETYHYEILAVVARDATGTIISGIPFAHIKSRLTGNRLVSLPFTDHCPVLERAEGLERVMVDKLKEYSGQIKSRYFELRTGQLEPGMEIGPEFVRHVLPLSKDTEAIFKQFDQKSVQWGIKKAQKMNVKFEFATDRSSVKRFIELNALTRKKHGILPQPDGLFYRLRELLFQNDLGFIVQAKVEGQVVASSVFLHFNGTFFYKYNASDPRFLKYQPNNLILWEAIKFAAANNGKSFDFGRSETSNRGLVDFKKRWETNELPLVYSLHPKVDTYTAEASGKSWKSRAVSVMATLLPTRVCRIVGGIIYRHAG